MRRSGVFLLPSKVWYQKKKTDLLSSLEFVTCDKLYATIIYFSHFTILNVGTVTDGVKDYREVKICFYRSEIFAWGKINHSVIQGI